VVIHEEVGGSCPIVDQFFSERFVPPMSMTLKRHADSEDEDIDNSSLDSSDSLSSDTDAETEDDWSSDDEEIVNCDFEFFDPQKQDFVGIKHLLRQLFDTDADLFDLGALAEMVLAQPLVGSTVKTEGQEGDPLSFLTVLNLRVHKVTCSKRMGVHSQEMPIIRALLNYFLEKAKTNSYFEQALSARLGEENGDVGLILSERIVNMPSAVAAPSYRMLLEELEWANEDVHGSLMVL